MKKISFLILSILLISCFSEPKKEDSLEKDTNMDLEVENTSSTKENKIINNEELNQKIDKESTNTVIERINEILKYSKYSEDLKLILIDRKNQIFLLNNKEFNLNNVYLIYEKRELDIGYGTNYVFLECIKNSNGSNCIYTANEYVSSFGFPMNSKEKCDVLILEFQKLKETFL